MNTTIQNDTSHYAHSLSGESGQGGAYGGMALLKGKIKNEQQDQDKNKLLWEPVKWERISDKEKTNQYKNKRYGYAEMLPLSSRKMAPMIGSSLHREIVEHKNSVLSKNNTDPSAFSPLPYSVAIPSGTKDINIEKPIERWDRNNAGNIKHLHPIIANRRIVLR